jgi:hypothetical protein
LARFNPPPDAFQSTPALNMNELIVILPSIAAIGFSLLYLILGGGLGGAILVFIVAKLLGK